MPIKPELASLHRYFLRASRNKSLFLQQLQRNQLEHLHTRVHLDLWYACLYVVVEGFRKERIHDEAVAGLLRNSKKLALLRGHRNAVLHYSPDYTDPRELKLFQALLNFEWVTRSRRDAGRERMVLSCSPSVRRWRLRPGTLGPCKAWPSGHRLRRQGLDKGQRPGTRSTMRSTARKGWITHFHPLVFQERPISRCRFCGMGGCVTRCLQRLLFATPRLNTTPVLPHSDEMSAEMLAVRQPQRRFRADRGAAVEQSVDFLDSRGGNKRLRAEVPIMCRRCLTYFWQGLIVSLGSSFTSVPHARSSCAGETVAPLRWLGSGRRRSVGSVQGFRPVAEIQFTGFIYPAID
jgi:hypothetical protein